MGMGGVYLILTSASLLHFKRINKNSTLNIFHEFATAKNTTLFFCKIQSLSFSYKCEFSVVSAHAAALSLLNRLCKSFCKLPCAGTGTNKSFLKNPMLCPFPKLWLSLRTTSGVSSQNLQNTQNHCYQRIYSHH